MYPLVDVHTHVFNHRHLPIEGIVTERLDRKLGAGLSRKLGRMVRDLVAKIGSHEDLTRIVTRAARQKDGIPVIARAVAVRVTRREGRRAMVRDRAALEATELEAVLAPLDEAEPEVSFEALVGEMSGFLDEVGAQRSPVPMEEAAFLDPVEDAFAVIKDFLEFLSVELELVYPWFFGELLEPVVEVWRDLEETYADDGMDLFVHLMMDMQLAYERDEARQPLPNPPEPPALSYVDQIDEMVALTWRARGRLVGFVAFDPRRPGAFGEVERALDAGMVGVKIYPSMGYRPLDQLYRAALEELYGHCEAHGIPVLTHCSWGDFEAYPGSAACSEPAGEDGWEGVLAAYPALRLCIGHAGGGGKKGKTKADRRPGWYHTAKRWDDPRCFAAQATQLCASRSSVYADLSFFWKMVKRKKIRNRVQDHLVRLYTDPAFAGLPERLMYGSDWHMPEALPWADNTLHSFQTIFQHPTLAPHASDFFGLNALRFLNLQAAVQRLGQTVPQDEDVKETLLYWTGLAAMVGS